MKALNTLGSLPPTLALLGVACARCERRGLFRVARLIAEHGADATLYDVVRGLVGDCPRKTACTAWERCDPHIATPLSELKLWAVPRATPYRDVETALRPCYGEMSSATATSFFNSASQPQPIPAAACGAVVIAEARDGACALVPVKSAGGAAAANLS